MKWRALILFCCVVPWSVAGTQEEPVVLARIVVSGTKIPTGWLTVSWECKGPLPIDRIKRAWISQVLPDSPADKAGMRIGDALLELGGVPVEKLTAVSLRWDLEREREPGSEERFLLKTGNGEKRLIVLTFEKRTAH